MTEASADGTARRDGLGGDFVEREAAAPVGETATAWGKAATIARPAARASEGAGVRGCHQMGDASTSPSGEIVSAKPARARRRKVVRGAGNHDDRHRRMAAAPAHRSRRHPRPPCRPRRPARRPRARPSPERLVEGDHLPRRSPIRMVPSEPGGQVAAADRGAGLEGSPVATSDPAGKMRSDVIPTPTCRPTRNAVSSRLSWPIWRRSGTSSRSRPTDRLAGGSEAEVDRQEDNRHQRDRPVEEVGVGLPDPAAPPVSHGTPWNRCRRRGCDLCHRPCNGDGRPRSPRGATRR